MPPSTSYQIVLLGALDARCDLFRARLIARVEDLGLAAGEIDFLDASTSSRRDRRFPTVALFFGASSVTDDTPLVDDLVGDSVVIVPIVSSTLNINNEIPPQLRHINALEFLPAGEGVERLASLALETFRLLRRSRRLFISYRRVDVQPFAEKLYDALDARGFDVFIDVRSVPPAVDFQSELWHRMSDSDVVVLIDTPGFRASRWTTAELAQANATNLQILHVLWPGQREDPTSSFSHFLKLNNSDFWGHLPFRGQWVRSHAVGRICQSAEELRARAIAARHRYLIDNFCDAARDQGLVPSIQPQRWVSVPLKNGRMLAVVPAVGVPTSDRINAIFDSISDSQVNTRDYWVVYDNRGILSTWLAHLDWLDIHLPIRSVRMSNAPDALKAFSP